MTREPLFRCPECRHLVIKHTETGCHMRDCTCTARVTVTK